MSNPFDESTVPSGLPRQSRDYACTEIITIRFAYSVDLNRDATPVGQLWAITVQAYLVHGARTVRWGRRVDSPQAIKLIIDWKTIEDRQQFLASPDFLTLQTKWQMSSLTSQSSDPSLFALSSHAPSRRGILSLPERSSFKDSISVSLSLSFSPAFEISAIDSDGMGSTPCPRWALLEQMWNSLCGKVTRSEGGWIAGGRVAGWSVNPSGYGWQGAQERSFLGLIRFLDYESARRFFERALEDGVTRSKGPLAFLRSLSAGALEIEFVRMMGEESNGPPPGPNPFSDPSFRLLFGPPRTTE